MAFFGTLFSKEKKKEEEIVEETPTSKVINPHATMIQNEIYCNACGQLIENTPTFFNLNGRKMVFHKKCYKKIKSGNINI